MKKIIKYTLLASLFILSLACEEFLTEVPQSEYSVAGSYRTQGDFESGIAACYDVVQDLHRPFQSWFNVNQGRGDEYLNGSNFDGFKNFTVNETSKMALVGWQSFYKIITYANTVLDNIEQGDFNDLERKKYIKGEAYMLRAYAYYSLGWNFGGVPLLDKFYATEDILKIARSTQDETFAFAEKDYKEAILLLPESWDNSNKGRVTKYAAQAMLARMYMFQKKEALAKPLFQAVINSGKHGFADKYEDIFNDGFDNTKERIWEAQFTGGQLGEGTGSIFTQLPAGVFDPEYAPVGGGNGAVRVSDTLYKRYQDGDLRRDLSILKNPRIFGIVDNISKFVLKFSKFTYKPKDNLDYANNLPIIRYTDVALQYAEILNNEGYIPNGEAFEIINKVRQRAGLPPLTSASTPDQQSFTEALRQERKFEFAFEAIRWRDLVRWGIAKETMNFHLGTELITAGWSMEDHNIILPIPFETLTRYNNTNIMFQNPGY